MTVLLTGASSGIGFTTARYLHERGIQVIGLARNPQKVTDAPFPLWACDITAQASVDALVKRLEAETISVDVLINNAGILVKGVAEEIAIEQAKNQFETNFWGAVRLTNALLPTFRRRRSGKIINISSLAGLIPAPGEAFYVASKFALEGYSRTLHYELASFGIQVTLIEPGFIRTDLDTNALEASLHFSDYDALRDVIKDNFKRSINGGADPGGLAALIYEVVTKPKIKLAYRYGRDARLLPYLETLAPSLFSMGLKRTFQLK